MILGLNQPYFIPYIGYWQLISSVDVFVIADDYNYIMRGWVNRNRILIGGETSFFNVELCDASQNKKINEIEIADIPLEKKYRTLRCAYGKAPHFDDGMALMERIYSFEGKNLADFLANSMREVCSFLGITTKLVRSSDFAGNSEYKREYRIYDIAKRLGADSYYNAIGGQELYSYDEFKARGIKLAFIKTGDVRYKQFKNEFIPSLSILDVIMFCSVDEIKEMLGQYTLLFKNE